MEQSIDFNSARYILALQEGSREAFDTIHMHYADHVFSFCMTQIRNRMQAQDIVQDTFMKLWEKRRDLDPNGNLRALILTIARHRIIDVFRKQVYQVRYEDYSILSDCHESEMSTDRQLVYNEFVLCVERCKQHLTPREAEIFEMSREKNLSIKDIAKKLNLSPQTVKNHLTSSLKIFRSELLKGYILTLLLILLD